MRFFVTAFLRMTEVRERFFVTLFLRMTGRKMRFFVTAFLRMTEVRGILRLCAPQNDRGER